MVHWSMVTIRLVLQGSERGLCIVRICSIVHWSMVTISLVLQESERDLLLYTSFQTL